MRGRLGRLRRAIGAAIALLVVASCGDSGNPAAQEPSSGEALPVVFPAGQLVWAQRSTIHVGDQTYDVSPHLVTELAWTPYTLYLRLTDDPVGGPAWRAGFDGKELRKISDVDGPIVTSPDGKYVAWLGRNGPLGRYGRLDQVEVYDARNGDRVFTSHEGMGDRGDDLADLYGELNPRVLDFRGETLRWSNAEGSGQLVTTDLATGASTVTDDWDRWSIGLTYGLIAWSPDGKYRLEDTSAEAGGRLEVSPGRPRFTHRWQRAGQWLDDHTLVVVEFDRRRMAYDPTKPDRTAGELESCNLDTGRCRSLGRVTGAFDVVFPGVFGEV